VPEIRPPRISIRLSLSAPLIGLSLLLMGCFEVDAEPESANNPVGTTHTISADVDALFPDDEWLATFLIIHGPNAGQNSACDSQDIESIEELEDCLTQCSSPEECNADNCDPSCAGEGDEEVSWTYESGGDSGTDYIAVCVLELAIAASLEVSGLEQSFAGIAQASDEELQDEIEELEDMDCDVVTKTWEEEETEDDEDEDDEEEPEARFLGGGLFAGDMSAAQRNRARAQASAAVASTPRPAAAAVRPPSTGDGGLLP
jgi:hypothetical protein